MEQNRSELQFRGVYVVMVTPFTADGDVDLAGIRKNVRFWVESGVHGIIPLGSTGEFAGIDDADRSPIISTVLEAVEGRIPVVVGATAETTERAVRYSTEAERLGAHGLLVLPPYYYSPTPDEIVDHYLAVGDSVDIPVMIYNNPGSSKVDILPETVERIAGHPNVRYIKESSGDIRRITEIRMRTEGRMTVFCGWEDMAYESFVLGAEGWVSVIANVAPALSVRLFALSTADRVAALGLYRTMLPFLRYLEYSGRIQKSLKHLLDRMGLAGGYSTSPKRALEPDQVELVERLFDELSRV